MLYAPSNRSANPSENPDPVWLLVFGLQLVGQRVHDDFGVGVALQVIVALVEQLFLELLVVGKLAVECEREPLGLASVVALERLGVRSVVAAASGVAHVADGDRPVHLPHDRLELVAVIEPERLGDRPHFFVGLDERIAVADESWPYQPRAVRGFACPAAFAAPIAPRC